MKLFQNRIELNHLTAAPNTSPLELGAMLITILPASRGGASPKPLIMTLEASRMIRSILRLPIKERAITILRTLGLGGEMGPPALELRLEPSKAGALTFFTCLR